MPKSVLIFLKNPWFIAAVCVAVIGTGTIAIRQHDWSQTSQSQNAGPIVASGTVESADTVDLAFQNSGQVVKITKVVGDRVAAGETIVEINNTDLKAELKQAEATVSYQEAELQELEYGTSSAELSVIQDQVSNDQSDLASTTDDLISTLIQSYSSAEDALHNKIDDFFLNPTSANPQLVFAVTVTPETSIESGRVVAEASLTDLQNLTVSATSTTDVSALSDSVKGDLAEIKLFLDNTAPAVDALTPNGTISQALINEWKDDTSAAQAEVNASITAILAEDDAVKSANDILTLAQHQLDLEETADVSAEIAAQKAKVSQAEAMVDGVNASLANTYLTSPISGVVSRQDARLGETVNAGVNIVSIIGDSEYEIMTDIPQNDVGTIKIGEPATVTLDAYGSSTLFDAVVVGVDPIASTTNGETTYITTLQFKNFDDRIKSGMTGQVFIGQKA